MQAFEIVLRVRNPCLDYDWSIQAMRTKDFDLGIIYRDTLPLVIYYISDKLSCKEMINNIKSWHFLSLKI